MLSVSSIERILTVILAILETAVRVIEKFSPEPGAGTATE